MSAAGTTLDPDAHVRNLPAEAQRRLGELNELNVQHELLEEQVRPAHVDSRAPGYAS